MPHQLQRSTPTAAHLRGVGKSDTKYQVQVLQGCQQLVETQQRTCAGSTAVMLGAVPSMML
jgi:hypothetical protein